MYTSATAIITIITLLSLTQNGQSDCTRSSLQALADAYIASQTAGSLSPIFSSAKYTQNNKTMAKTSSTSILATVLGIDHNRTLLDTKQCATYTELISTWPEPGHVIGTQIRAVDEESSNGTLTPTLIDSIVTTEGDWLFNATKSLLIVEGESWEPLAPRFRVHRDDIKAAIDAYLDLWGNPNASVPWGQPCRRMEGSAYTGSGSQNDSCNVGIPGGNQPPVTNRRYVVDGEYGAANVLCDFGAMRNGAPDSHEIRLEGGKLRFVHTMTVMRAGGV